MAVASGNPVRIRSATRSGVMELMAAKFNVGGGMIPA